MVSYLAPAVFNQRILPVGFSRRAFPPRPPNHRRAGYGCMRSSMTASGSSPARTASGCGSTADPERPYPSLPADRRGGRAAAPALLIIDGEAVACDETGVSRFDRLRYRRDDGGVFLYAFDLIELDGGDLRREPLEVRKATLASVLPKASPGLRLNEHITEPDGAVVFAHACKMGLGRHRLQAEGFALPLRPLPRLAQVEEPTMRGGAARGRGRRGR